MKMKLRTMLLLGSVMSLAPDQAFAQAAPALKAEAAANVERGERDTGAGAHPGSRGERALVGVGILDLAADMEGNADAEADIVHALGELDRMRGTGAELLRKLIGRMAACRDAHE